MSPSMSLKQPLISVCMPCHNAANYLTQALESVIAQSYPAVEIIAVNDSSTDSTAEILEQFAADHGVKVLHSRYGNASQARNLAFARSQGEFIKYFDADDVMSTNMIESQVGRLSEHRDCIASSRWKRFIVDLEERDFEPDALWADRDAADWLVDSMRGGGHHSMMQCGMFLIPREVIEARGGWDERLSLIDDTEFFGRMIAGCRRVLFTDGALYYRSAISGSLSARKSRSAYQSAVLSITGFCEHLLGCENSPRTRRVAADLCQAYAFEVALAEPDLAHLLQNLAAELGGSSIRPSGGPVFNLLSRFLGWKAAARLRTLGRNLGYERHHFRARATK